MWTFGLYNVGNTWTTNKQHLSSITYQNVLQLSSNEFNECLSVFISSDKVLVHCFSGISHSVTLFLAYLMIHHDMMVEDAIVHVLDLRWIRPNNGFLMQLTILNSHLVQQRKLQLRKQLAIYEKNSVKTVPEPEPQVTNSVKTVPEPQETTEFLMLKKHIHQNMINLKKSLEKCTLDLTPVTEVWPNVYIGNA